MKRDSRVDDYIATAQPFARSIFERLRDLMEEVVSEGHEDIKWGAPHLIVGGRNLAGMGAFKAHARFFLHGALSADEKTTWDRFGKLEAVDDCPDPAKLEIRKLLGSTGYPNDLWLFRRHAWRVRDDFEPRH